VDIIYLEREKGIIRYAIDSAKSKLKMLDAVESFNYLNNHPNIEIRELIKTITYAADHIKTKYHQEYIKEIMSISLAVMCKDEQFCKILSESLSLIKDYNVDIKQVGKLTKLDKIILKIAMKTAYTFMLEKDDHTKKLSILLSDANNTIINYLYNEIVTILNEEYDEKDSKMYIRFFEIGLYVLYQDTAYFDPFMWILDKVSCDKIRKIIKPFVKSPELWYCNIWVDSMALTSEQRKKGIIPQYEHSIVERRMVASKQISDLYKKLRLK